MDTIDGGAAYRAMHGLDAKGCPATDNAWYKSVVAGREKFLAIPVKDNCTTFCVPTLLQKVLTLTLTRPRFSPSRRGVQQLCRADPGGAALRQHLACCNQRMS